MIKIQLGAETGPERTATQQLADAQWLQELLKDERFGRLVTMAADACAREWQQGKTLDAREAAFAKLQGLEAIVTEMQKVFDQGLRVLKSGQGA